MKRKWTNFIKLRNFLNGKKYLLLKKNLLIYVFQEIKKFFFWFLLLILFLSNFNYRNSTLFASNGLPSAFHSVVKGFCLAPFDKFSSFLPEIVISFSFWSFSNPICRLSGNSSKSWVTSIFWTSIAGSVTSNCCHQDFMHLSN